MHSQLQEAQKRLQVAKDAYLHAVGSIDAQYVKPLSAAGVEAEGVAAIRSDYYVIGEVGPLAEQDRPAPPGKPTTRKKTSAPKKTRK